ncbi:MAG: PQQ-binding-like beta-propeller repeat protein [Planctomycetia bacterium]|nr:PQQ-binding-like beta-propeller repeat protein [Planctomycetia bacterium]
MNARLPLLLLGLLTLALNSEAADWPQWQGPNRTNVSDETGLLKSWTASGPKLLWTFAETGVGYSAPAVVGDQLFIMGARNNTEQIICLDVKTGKQVWAANIGTQFNNGYGDGPRGTPTVDGNFVFGLGGQGDLVCVEKGSGKPVWKKSMQKDFGGKMMSGWGYSESPLVDGDKLVCTPGGGKGTVVALDKKTGKTLWQSSELKDDAAYSSLIAADVAGVRQYLLLTGKSAAGVAAKDGKLLWQHAKNEFRTAVVPTPIYHDNHVFITADYGAGCDLLKLTPAGGKFKAEAVYTNKNMENHHGGVVLLDGHLYGCSGNSNGRTFWRCLDWKTGKVLWEEGAKLKAGSLTAAGGQLYLYSQDNGTCVLLDPNPQGWKEAGRFKIPQETKVPRKQGKIWTHPVVSNGRLYLRDEDLLFCFDVRAAAE